MIINKEDAYIYIYIPIHGTYMPRHGTYMPHMGHTDDWCLRKGGFCDTESRECFLCSFCIANYSSTFFIGPKESCKEKDLFHFLEAFLLRKPLGLPRRYAPESRELGCRPPMLQSVSGHAWNKTMAINNNRKCRRELSLPRADEGRSILKHSPCGGTTGLFVLFFLHCPKRTKTASAAPSSSPLGPCLIRNGNSPLGLRHPFLVLSALASGAQVEAEAAISRATPE